MAIIFFDPAVYREEADALELIEEPPGSRVFGIDLAAPNGAIEALIAAKRAGMTCAVFPILPDPFEATLQMIGTSIAATTDPDLQMDQFIALRIDQLMVNGVRPSQLAQLPEQLENTSALVLRLADLILLASPGERDRYTSLHHRAFRRTALTAVKAATVPAFLDEKGVTIFAPSTQAAKLTHFVKLMQLRRIEPIVISAENAAQPIATRVVLTPEWRPMRARSLAASGHHVIAPNTTRVDECDSRIFGYKPVDYRSLMGALDTAFSEDRRDATIVTSSDDTSNAIVRESARVLDGPRVSIIVRTYDRPALLARAIASIANQTYRNVEIVVVNNGGDDVRHVVESAAAGRPFCYEAMPERKLIGAASNVGARVSSGEYVGYLDDDDLLYGDHCARTAEVLNRTGLDLVFTLCVSEYAEMSGAEKTVIGYQLYLDRDFHFDDVFISNMSPIHSIVHRRTIFDRIGYFDEALPVTDDWELWLRLAVSGARFARIDRATCEYSWRYDPNGSNMTIDHQWDFVRAFDSITDRYAAHVAARPSVRAGQANARAAQVKRAEDTIDPGTRAQVVINSMSQSVVRVAPDWERRR